MVAKQDTSVVVVGGSLVGLSTALFLSHYGVSTILLERHTGSSLHPRAMGYTTRTIELLRTVGADSRIKGVQWKGGPPRRIVVESLAGNWKKEQNWGAQKPRGPPRGPPPSTSAYSPVEGVAIAQDIIEPVLRDRASELGAELKLGYTVTEWTQDDTSVTVNAISKDNVDIRIKADYLVACDGDRSPIREKLGIQRHGVGLLHKLQSIMFRCEPLEQYLNHGYQQFQIEGRQDGFEAFMTTYGDGRWMLAWKEKADDTTQDDIAPNDIILRNIIRKASGREDLRDEDIHIITSGRWDIGGRVADQFSSGRIFLTGDAAHALPPNRGGYGANTGIADAHNLAWKLAAVVHGESTPELLDTYDEERRPIADARHDQIFAREDYRKYAEDRNWPGKNVEIQDDLAMELGYYYRSKSIIDGPDGSAIVKKPDEWNGQPGTRAPHVALCSKDTQISSLDFFGKSWVVMTKNEAWKDPVSASAEAAGIAITFVHLGGDATEKDEGDFNRLFGLEDGGAALIRPDGFIAWRSRDWLIEAEKELAQALIQTSCSSKEVTFSGREKI